MTHRQERAIQALLECPTLTQAAQAAGVGISTLRRWMKQDTAFMAAYRAAVSEILESTTRKAQRATGEAIDVLKIIMLDPDAPPGARTQAADKILIHAARMTEQNDIMSRLDALEESLSEVENQ